MSSGSESKNVGADIGNQIKHGLAGIHGVGEAIRGNMTQAVDGAFGEKEGEAKNKKIIESGLNEIEDGKYRGHPDEHKRF